MRIEDPKVVRTRDQYKSYLTEVQALMAKSPALNTADSDRIELLTVLLEAYEADKHPIESPDPIDAIQFRMAEKGLRQADLIPYFGTSSRVSEVLNRKRPLTVQMIRALSVGLGISAETLLGLASVEPQQRRGEVDWSKFPIAEMTKRGWLRAPTKRTKESIEALVQSFIADAGLSFGGAAFKRTIAGDAQSPITRYSLYAWLAKVIQSARATKSRLGVFNSSTLDGSFLKEVAQISWSDQGPLLAVEFLEKHGIAVVIEPHLKGTHLDGAALKDLDGTPIVGLTLRHDRLDNFWHTLLHELAHLWKHVGDEEAFLDDLDMSSEDRRESEANRLAREASIPRLIWKRSDAFITPSKHTIDKLSRELRIHPAVVAGRLHRETGNYQLFADLIGQGEVRRLFRHSGSSHDEE